MAPEQDKPPYYIFISNSSLLATQTSAPSSLLSHPNIQYHYLDDSPLSLLPQSPDEQVLVLDYDPANVTATSVKSTSSSIAVTGIKVTDAPGAGVVDDVETNKNDKMYVIQVSSIAEIRHSMTEDASSPQSVLAKFKQRNATLRRSLDSAVDAPPLQSPQPPQLGSTLSSTPTQTPLLG